MQVFQDAGLGELRIKRPYETEETCSRKIFHMKNDAFWCVSVPMPKA
jgi:hypothetical protein